MEAKKNQCVKPDALDDLFIRQEEADFDLQMKMLVLMH